MLPDLLNGWSISPQTINVLINQWRYVSESLGNNEPVYLLKQRPKWTIKVAPIDNQQVFSKKHHSILGGLGKRIVLARFRLALF